MKTGGRREVFNEINITPLTDIFLVLLIIMMIVAPMMVQARSDIKPPEVESGSPVDQGLITVEVTKDGEFYVDGNPTQAEQLTDTFKARAESLAEKNVVIRADKATKSGAVLKVLQAARDAAYEKVTVAGEALTKERQRELQQAPAAGEEPS